MTRCALVFLVIGLLAATPLTAQVDANGALILGQREAPRSDVSGVEGEGLLDAIFGTQQIVTVCLNTMDPLDTISWFWTLQIEADLVGQRAYVLDGSVTGTICDPGGWTVTDGFVTSSTMYLTATHTGSGMCLTDFFLQGTYSEGDRVGRTWKGLYCFGTTCFFHNTAVVGLGPCP